MDLDRSSAPPGAVVEPWRSSWSTWVPALVVALSLAGLATVPLWFEGRLEERRARLETSVEPARDAVDELQFALAAEAAAKRGYLLTADTTYLRRYRSAVQQRRAAVARLEALGPALGADLRTAVEELRRRSAPWDAEDDPARLLGAADPTALGRSQAAYEDALLAARDVAGAAAREAQRLLSDVRTMEGRRGLATGVLLLLAGVSTALVLWFAWGLRRLAGRLARQGEQERAARAAAEQAVRAREEVLAVVSHDLRSPLSTIAMSASTLRDLPLEAERRERYVDIIERTAVHMGRLIEDLLEVARLDAGRALPLRIERASIEPLLREAVDSVSVAASRRTIDLELELPAEPLPPLPMDRHRMVRVVGNLLDNALKYTPDGGRVCVRACRAEDRLVIQVEDTGRGMSPEELRFVFTPFWQGGSARGGAGLGTTIARAIVEAHGGTLEVDSRAGLGTTFEIRLPMGD